MMFGERAQQSGDNRKGLARGGLARGGATTRDCPYNISLNVGAILYGCPSGLILKRCA